MWAILFENLSLLYSPSILLLFLVLPLMAQMHLFTGRGRSCIESLMYLRQTTKGSSETVQSGYSSYFLTCFDIILDGGFALEHVATCIDYVENIESMFSRGKGKVSSRRKSMWR